MHHKDYPKLCGDDKENEHRITEKGERRTQLSQWPMLEGIVSKVLTPVGFEAYPFHVGWYNELVGPRFYLDYPDNTVALVILSGPDTFEKCVIPFVRLQCKDPECPKCDALDGSMRHVFKTLLDELQQNNFEADAIHDFEMHPSRKPKVLVQTAAHVSGVAEYFHRDRIIDKNENALWLKDAKLFGVAIHPGFGGWFAIRGVFILKNLIPDSANLLSRPERPFPIIDESVISHLLEEFAVNWKAHIWRDILPRTNNRKYSQYFIDYLGTDPEKRWDYVQSLPILQENQ